MRWTFVGFLLGIVLAAAVVYVAIGRLPDRPIVPVSPRATALAVGATPAVTPTPIVTPSPSPTIAPPPSIDPAAAATTGIRIGNTAPGIALARADGGTFNLLSHRGRAVWVTFTASWCPSCRDELRLLSRFHQQLGSRIDIIAVDVKEDPDVVKALVAETQVAFPFAIDADGSVQKAWGVYALPVHFWLDDRGVVRDFLVGEAGPDEFLSGVRSVLPGATFTP